METEKNLFTARAESRKFEVDCVKVRAKVLVRDNKIELQHSKLLKTKISHALIEKPFVKIDPVKGDRAILAVTENEQSTKISISFPDAKIGTKKIFHADWKVEEE